MKRFSMFYSAMLTGCTLGLVSEVTRAQCEFDRFEFDDVSLIATSNVQSDPIQLSGDGRTLVIGGGETRVDGMSGVGSALIYVRDGDRWTRQTRIDHPFPVFGDKFAWSIGLSSDGNFAAFGTFLDDGAGEDSGSVYIYARVNDNWVVGERIVASDASEDDWFGSEVALSDDGSTLVVGARYAGTPGSEAGAAYVFTRTGNTWQQQAKLAPTELDDGAQFGATVDVSSDGNRVIVGAAFQSDVGTVLGAAYIFERSGESWTQTDRIGPATGAGFGWKVAMSADAQTIVVGSPGEGDGINALGAVYIYRETNGTWVEQLRLTNEPSNFKILFGTEFDIDADGSRAIISETLTPIGDAGRALIFDRTGDEWTQVGVLEPRAEAEIRAFAVKVGLTDDGTEAVSMNDAALSGDRSMTAHDLTRRCDLVLAPPVPGIAGQVNSITATWPQPGDEVLFAYAPAAGETPVPGCPGLTAGLARPSVFGSAVTDDTGDASFVSFISPLASGRTVFLQAVQLDNCVLSNVVEYMFP